MRKEGFVMREIEERMKDPLFAVNLAMWYHDRRWSFIHHLENWILFFAGIMPLGAPFVWKWFAHIDTDGLAKFPWWLVIVAMVYILVWFYVEARTGKEDAWTRTKFSRKHRDARRRFGDIERQLMFAKDSDGIAAAVAELAVALRENPLRLKVLTAVTYNGCLVAREYSPSLLHISLWQRIMASWCDVHTESIVPIGADALTADRQGATNAK